MSYNGYYTSLPRTRRRFDSAHPLKSNTFKKYITEKRFENLNNHKKSKRIFSDEERQAPIEVYKAEPSHLARYQFALDFIARGDKVLDVPCGSGYGTKLLTSKEAEIYGVDIYTGAIEHAKEFFSDKLNSFLVGDMENMKKLFPQDNIFDVIVSFEDIEHIKHPEKFLDKAKRLLKDKGKFIISTPRKPHDSPYHIREYSLEEFKQELSKNFNIQKIYGQIYTDIFDLESRKVNSYEFKRFNYIAYCVSK